MEKAKQQQGGGGGGVVMLVEKLKMITSSTDSNQNPVEQLKLKYKDLETNVKTWVSKQPIYVEAAVVSAVNAVQGAVIGGLMGTLTGDISSSLPPPPPPGSSGPGPQGFDSIKQAQAIAGGPLVQARNFAVMTGVNAGLSCVLKRIRGKEDIQSSMIAAFGSGTAFSLVSGMGGPNPMNAISSGLFFALAQGALYKIGENFSRPKEDDVLYARGRSMLITLGLQNYEKNFKRGLLTDNTLPLLTDSALRDVKIPPGPRLLILDHVQRDPELRVKQGSRS